MGEKGIGWNEEECEKGGREWGGKSGEDVRWGRGSGWERWGREEWGG